MGKNLLIVESPAKAKTIEKYLGKDFTVKSSYGHIRDLDKGKKGVIIEDDFQPNYVVSPEKEKVVKELKTAVKKAEEVWLATDEDREGEAISWHLCEVLGLDTETTKRIVFREITKPAVQSAIKNPRSVDINLVNAQQARRILDRLVGFELSEILWRKVKNKLSAGRVQSVSVKLVVEREREILNFNSESYFKVVAIYNVKNEKGKSVELKAELASKLPDIAAAKDFVEKCNNAEFSIANIEVKPAFRKPPAPFITSTLQQDASRKLSFGVKHTMSVAQRLYEQGFISYMRTDSTTLSEQALGAIADEITSSFGKEYLETRRYKSKKKDAQEAHEAIRPTYIDRKVVTEDRDQQRLYDLIRKRTMASQMARAELEKTTVSVGISTMKDTFLKAQGEVLKFDGFLAVYMEGTDDDENQEAKGILPPLKLGQILELDELQAVERFTRPPARFTEASLVKKLEELGIGRPSTYAPTISKIMEIKRGYVTKESREGIEREYNIISLKDGKVLEKKETEITGATSKRLYPTDLGMLVTDFLSKHFTDIMNYSFTAGIEEEFDVIANGDKKWTDMLKGFYHPFHNTVEETIENASREKGRRDLGIDPETGRTVLVQMTRFGPVCQIGTREEVGEDDKPRFASLQRGQSMATITYEDAMELFKLPRSLGDYKDHEMVVALGRFGPYIKYNELFVSIPRDEDPMTLSKERGEELVDIKLKEIEPVGYFDELPITKGKGRFGPYLKWNSFFVNVPKRYDFENITKAEMDELITAKKEKEANRYIKIWDKEKLMLENGRWGPFIRYKKKSYKLPKKKDPKEKWTKEELLEFDIEHFYKIIEDQAPGTVKKKAPKKAAKKTTKKKATAKKKAPAKNTAAKKPAKKAAATAKTKTAEAAEVKES